MGRLRLAILLAAFVGCAATVPQAQAPAGATTVTVSAPAPAGPPTEAPPLPAAERPPPMGWSSWSRFRREVRESDIKAQADVLAATFAPFGYVYVNVDGGWFDCCDEHGRAKPDPQKFPGGMAALAAYVHGKGLKMGIYLHPGIQKEAWDANGTVAGTSLHIRDIADVTRHGNTKATEASFAIDFSKPGAAEHIRGYANLLASWGVDYLKLDFVGSGRGAGRLKADNREEVSQWSAALKATGRPIWLELSFNLDFAYASFWKTHGNGWRITPDIEYYKDNSQLTSWHHVLPRFEAAAKWASFAGPGGWNDLDSLELGNGDADGLTLEERVSTMTLWAITCSPLFLGSDLTKLDPTDVALLTNKEVLAVDQSGHVATPLVPQAKQQVWRAANPDGSFTVALFNLGDEQDTVAVSWRDLGIAGAASLHDLWNHRDLGRLEGGYQVALAGHASQLLRVRP